MGRLPDFLIIGAARCGTTWMYEHLRAHPQIYLPPQKRPEPHFFLKEAEYSRGIGYYSDRYFQSVGPGVVAGEASTSYLYHPVVPPRIREHLPRVKLVAILRDPAERAFSSYWFTRRNGLDDLPFSEAIRAEPARLEHAASAFDREVRPHAYIDRGRYWSQLTRYLELLEPGQLLVLLFEDLVAQPVETLRRVFSFLGVDSARAAAPAAVHEKVNGAEYGGETLSAADRAYIVAAIEDDIRGLARWLGRDLSHWLA